MRKPFSLSLFCATTLFALAATLCTTPAQAQWFKRKERMSVRGELSPDQLRRKGLKDAKRYRSDYKTTHLNTSAYEFRPDRTGRKAKKDERHARRYRSHNLDRGANRSFWAMFSRR